MHWKSGKLEWIYLGTKQMEELVAVTAKQLRQPIKTQSHFNNYPLWKQKLRQNCCRRLKEDRAKLLWRMRLPALNNKDVIRTAFEDIVSDELKKIKNSSLDVNSQISTCAPEANDKLWEYDGLHNAYEGECEEILLEMQRIFYEDLLEYPSREEPLKNIETWEDEEDEYLANAVIEHMQLNDEQVHKKTWCPICKRGELQESNQIIYCTRCELKLGKQNELNLDVLQTRLAEAHMEHLDKGCRMKPKFCIESRFGLTALYILCKNCNIFEIVV